MTPVDSGYSLELAHCGASNEYSRFLTNVRKKINIYTPVNPILLYNSTALNYMGVFALLKCYTEAFQATKMCAFIK